jgi:hypothetical protein
MQTRRIVLGLLIIVVVFIIVSRKFEGLPKSHKCYRSIAKFENGAYKTSGAGPPLSAKECNGQTMRKGGDCYKSNGKDWVKNNAAGKSCKSWTKYVNWDDETVRRNSMNPFRAPQGYKKKDNIDYNGDKNIGTVNAAGATSCGKSCNDKSECAGFTLRKAKNGDTYTCFLLDQARIDQGEKAGGSPDFVSYVKTSLAGKVVDTAVKRGKMCNKSGVKVRGFEDGGYSGKETQFNECGKNYDISPSGSSVDLTSFKIPRGYQVYMETDKGDKHTYYGDQDFSKSNTWNDKIKTVRVEECASNACWSGSYK